ncbi:MAG: hypothetical protein ACR2PG_19820, partial [Hyphomicrobiaceae bacterium]
MRYFRTFNSFLTITLAGTLTLAVTLLMSGHSHAGGGHSDWHGLAFKTLNFATAQEHGLLSFEGAVITNVEPAKSPDRKLKPGDGITYALTSKQNKIATAQDLAKFLDGVKPGQDISLVRIRKGAATTLVKLRRPKPERRIVESKTAGDTHLMLDSGGHMALVKDLAFTPDGQQIVSAGDDKVIRVWELSTGKTVRTIRGDLAPGPSGKMFAMALSPDGKWLAAAGWTGRKSVVPCCGDIRVFEFSTGRLVKLLKGHTSIVRGLEFSASGHRLISGSSDNSAIVWQAPRGRDKSADWSRGRLKVRLKGHSDDIEAVGLLPGGFRAITGSFDLTLRVWDLTDGKEIARLLGHSSGIQSLAVGPGGQLASGDIKGSIRLWSPKAIASAIPGSELTAILRLNQKGMVGTLKFSPNGKHLLSTCAKSGCKNTQVLWETHTGRRVGEFKGHNNVVLAAAWTPDGKRIATAGGTRFPVLLWKPDEAKIGHKPKAKAKRLVGAGRRAWSVAFSKNGKSIAWGRRWKRSDPVDRGPLQYEMQLPTTDRRLGQPRSLKDATKYVRGKIRKGAYSLRRRKGGKFNYHKHLDIMRGKKRVTTISRNSTNGYGHWAYTFAPDGKTLISGGANGALEAYSLTGKRLHRTHSGFVGHEHFVVALTPSPDGRLLISSGGDQTIRLWNLKTRELIVTLFHGAGGEWVMWTPQGYYTGSARGGELVGWQLNGGPEREAAYVRGQQLRKSLNRPDIIDDAIRLASAKAAIRNAGLATVTAASLLAAPPPLIRVYAQP